MNLQNELCPLCCEKIDMPDHHFFPCKCDYQVCMWCWYHIHESESGFCPECRIPYSDDPHEFSVVDIEEVIQAYKEKAAAEKREKEQLRQQCELQNHQHTGQTLVQPNALGNYNAGSMSRANLSSADLLATPLVALRLGSNIATVEKTVDQSKSSCLSIPPGLNSELSSMGNTLCNNEEKLSDGGGKLISLPFPIFKPPRETMEWF